MTYEEFLDELEERVCRQLCEGETIRRIRVLKNNGVRLDGLSYQLGGHKERPTVYVDHYYQEELSDRELDEAASQILAIQRESRLFLQEELEEILDYGRMKRRIFYRLVSQEKNQELLEDVPYLPWLDLAIVFYLRIPEHIMEGGTALIHTGYMEQWSITLGELYRTASANMAGVSAVLEPMENFLTELGIEETRSGLYILSNEQRDYGAAVIVDPKVQRMCREQLGEDFYVLPSSLHELILLPASAVVDCSDLDRIVQEVNGNCVGREDYLSSHVYRYSSKRGRLEF